MRPVNARTYHAHATAMTTKYQYIDRINPTGAACGDMLRDAL
jgi:hypothetical protein